MSTLRASARIPAVALQLQSRLTSDAEIHLTLATVPVPSPAPEEIVIRVEAAPINPSDLGAMIGPGDVTRLRLEESGDGPHVVLPVPPQAMRTLAAKVGQSLAAGIEGAGVVVGAGSSPAAQALLGRVVSVNTGAMFAQHRLANLAEVLVMKDGTTPAEAASSFINPMTALGMLETLRREGHTGLVHTAAASNLGQMLNRLCIADGVPLVNVVRSPAQVDLLKAIGASHVVDLTAVNFLEDLNAAIAATNATLCFDAIGGGNLVSQILTAMEAVHASKLGGYQRYGSAVHKQAYIYGLLEAKPAELAHTFGMAWGLGGWLLPNFLARIGPEATGRLRSRVTEEITTTFVSHYTRTISLREALDPATMVAYTRRATGEKYLIAPHL